MEEKTDRTWFWRIVDFINPLRDPSLTVAAVLTFIEEVGQRDAWYWIVVVALINWIAVRGVVWLIVNFTFASTFLARRFWWAIKHPNLAWRILDAVGHEEIVIGGFSEGLMLQNGIMGPGGFQVIGELPAGTEVPMLPMPNGYNGQMVPDLTALAATGILPAYTGQMGFPQMAHTGSLSDQGMNELPQRRSDEEERLRQQLVAYTRLLDDWIQFTEEKWRTVSDSQLGWKPLRGRWGGWDDIFQDAYAAKTSDPMAQAAQAAGDVTTGRYENSKDKGSAASAVACFMRDMMTLRRAIDMIQQSAEQSFETPDVQPAVTKRFGSEKNHTLLNNYGASNRSSNMPPPSTFIRRPAPIFVDADADK